MKTETDEYFDSIRGEATASVDPDKVRWGGKGKVQTIYYLADDRILNFVTFKWKEISNRPGLKAPVSFKKVPLSLLPKLERAQSHRQQVFVDFWTDKNGDNAEVITIATLSR